MPTSPLHSALPVRRREKIQALRRAPILTSTIAILAVAASFAGTQHASAATLFWDGNGALPVGGSGIWDTTSLNWETGALTGTYTTWNSATPDNAKFGPDSPTPATPVGTVTLGTDITAGTLTFNNAGYVIDLNGFNLTATAGLAGANLSSTTIRNNSATLATIDTATIIPNNNGTSFRGNLNLIVRGAWTPGALNDFTGTFTFKPSATATLLTTDNTQLGSLGSLLKLDATTAQATINFSSPASPQFQTFARNIELTHGAGTLAQLAVNGAKEITLSGVISGGTVGGSGLRVNSGQGNIVLTGANTFVGATTINGQGSMLTLANNNALGNTTSVTFTTNGARNTLGFRGGVTIDMPGISVDLGNTSLTESGYGSLHALSGDNTFTGNVINSTAVIPTTIGAEAGASLTLKGVVGGSARRGITKVGFGTVILTGANTFGRQGNSLNANATAINEGTLRLDFSQAAFDENIINNGVVDFTTNVTSELNLAGGTLEVKGRPGATNVQTFKNRVSSGVLTTGNPGFAILPGASAVRAVQNGAASLTINVGGLNAGLRFIGSTVDFTLPTTGSIILPAGGAGTPDTILTSNGTAFATVTGNDWAALDSSRNIVGGFTLAGFYTANTATDLAGNADMSGAPITTLTTSPTLTSLRFNNPAVRTINASGQTITTGGILVTPAVGNNISNIGGGTLQAASGTANQDLVIIQNNPANTLLITSAIVDNGTTGGLTKSGPGSLILGGVNTYAGETHLNGGITQLLATTALGGGKLFFHGGVLGLPGGTTFTRTVSTAAGGNLVQFIGSGGFVAYGGDVTINLGGSVTPTGLTMGTNTNGTNGFLPTGSALIFGAPDSDGAVIFQNPISFRSANQPQQREIRVINGSPLVDVDARMTGILNGDGGLTKTGNGTLELTGTNAYVSLTVIDGGTLRMGAAGSVPNSGLIVQNGVFDLNGFAYTASRATFTLGGGATGSTSAITTGVGSFTLSTNVFYNGQVANDSGATVSGNVNIGTAIRTFTVNDSTAAAVDLAIPATITGGVGGGVTKAGNGTLALLSASNFYSGATTVSAGTLLVSGSISGTNAINVLNGGTLGGDGSLNPGATMTVAAGSTIAPGVGVGTLSTGSATFNGGTLALQITDASTYDRLSVTGIVSLNAPVALTLSLASTFPAGTSFTILSNDQFEGINFTSGVTGFSFNNTLLGDGDTFTVTGPFGAQGFQISYDGDGVTDVNDVVLTAVAVPEPASTAFLLSGLALLAVRTRRARR
jgi:autotransporter-associated beta strand protein